MKRAKRSRRRENSKPPKEVKSGFPIVGVGASAGGLEAIGQLLSALPENPGIAIVVIQHLNPHQPSMTVEILARKTKLKVSEIKTGTGVEANHIYVLPPNKEVKISKGILTLAARSSNDLLNLPINAFLRSLAEDQGSQSIGVVLSGSASDGTEGLKAIKAEGGLAFAQDPKSAKYDSMPASAIASGVVDAVLTPEKIALELVRVTRHPFMSERTAGTSDLEPQEVKSDNDELPQILAMLKSQCKVDFTGYRQSTIRRRISRRVVLNRRDSLKDYLTLLRSDPVEVKRLFDDLLIHVTEFFRDPSVFNELKKKVFPKLIKARPPGAPIRIWVVGCSTGEEVYSVAISLLESLGSKPNRPPIQIFATDISEAALAKARSGSYPDSISQNVSAGRLQNFFIKEEGGYKINKSIRELCLFSRHDISRDPPFGKIDLVCCRNLLIYFEPALQKRILSIFGYSLQPNGVLVLGRSEGAGDAGTFFTPLDRDKKIFLRKSVSARRNLEFPTPRGVPAESHPRLKIGERPSASMEDTDREVMRITQAEYVPPHVVVNGALEILSTFGDVSPFLSLPSGQASLHLFKMARSNIVTDLRMAIQTTKKTKGQTNREFQIGQGARKETFSVRIIPLKSGSRPKDRLLIIFEPKPDSRQTGYQQPFRKTDYVKDMERKLAESRSYQESLITDFDTAQEELISANEELQSTNEEFQSTNEELETAKEELQSTNEELHTLNEELRALNSDANILNNDLNNLLASVDIPIVMVDVAGSIRRFTPRAGKMMNLISGDIGRPLADLKSTLDFPKLSEVIADVIENVSTQELEIQDKAGRWFRLQVRPYKTIDNKIEGAVIALVDIDILKRTLQETKHDLDYAISVADAVRLPLIVIGGDLTIQSANKSFFNHYPRMKNSLKKDFYAAFGEPADLNLGEKLSQCLASGAELNDVEAHFKVNGLGMRTLNFNASNIRWTGARGEALLVSVEDITERRMLENSLISSRSEAEKANRTKDAFLSMLSHELRTPLNSILSWAQLIKRSNLDIAKLKRGIDTIERSALTQGQLIDDLLDVTRIQSGKVKLNLEELDPLEPVRAAIESVSLQRESKNISIQLEEKTKSSVVIADPIRLQQVVWNLLTNAIKFSPSGSTIRVRVESAEDKAGPAVSIQVIDQGKGIKSSFLPQLFKRFSQADNSSTRLHGGVGLGLSIVHDLLELQNGSIRAESQGLGKGATFTVLIPATSSKTASKNQARKKPNKPARQPSPNLKGFCFLLVDDDESSLDALNETLLALGAETICRAMAAEAFLVLDDRDPDLLICDIAMPGEDGISLIRRIRARGPANGGDIPALALSANASTESKEEALAAGFDAYVAKPYDSTHLEQEISKIIQKAR